MLVQAANEDGLDTRIVCPTGVVGPFDYKRSEMGELILSWMHRGLHFMIDGAFDFVDVRDVALGQILARDNGKRGETYILGGERIELPCCTRSFRRSQAGIANDHVPIAHCYDRRPDGGVFL